MAPVVERLGPIGGGYVGLIGGTVGLNNMPPTIDLYGRCLVLVVEVEDVTGAIDGLLDVAPAGRSAGTPTLKVKKSSPSTI